MKEFARDYHALLTGEYAGINLTRITDFEDFYQKQILDSLIATEQSSLFQKEMETTKPHIDVGFGGGFPLLVLAKKYPNKKFIGFEARGKKAKVVNEIAHKLGLSNVKAYHQRLEDILINQEITVSFKAVGPIDRCINWINNEVPVQLFFYKGPSVFNDEIDPYGGEFSGWKINCSDELKLAGTNKRYLIGLMSENVLRGTNSKLVKVSEFI